MPVHLPEWTVHRKKLYLSCFLCIVKYMRPKIINIASHVAGWILFFSLILAFVSNSPNGESSVLSRLSSGPFLLFGGIYLGLFYVNYFVLIPAFYLQRKYTIYFAIVCMLFAAVYMLKPFDRLMSMNPPPNGQPRIAMGPPPTGANRPAPRGAGNRDINSIILFITIWSISTSIPVIKQWRLSEKKAIEAETERANAELAFLKSQVNPHFLFNTLNNIYSLAVSKSDNTAPSIMKLSNIMRYITDEAGQDFVPLQLEVDCMKDYIDLQRLRLGQKMTVDYTVTGYTDDKKIAPLLLMTFIENVFKYGISSHETSGITIKLAADNHAITFYCRNRLFGTKRDTERTGIGIANARKRLQHLYPNRHFLAIEEAEGYFTVQLTLQA